MTRGHRRLSLRQQTSRKTAPKPSANATGQEPRFAVRSLAVNALAFTGAAVSILTPVHAVTLGEITVDSALGQRLSARVPVEFGPGELLSRTCVTAPTSGKADLTRIPEPLISTPETVAPGSYDLRISTARPLYEPMYELQLQIRCPGTALLVRQYVLMLDLPSPVPQAQAIVSRNVVAAAPGEGVTQEPVDSSEANLAPTPIVRRSAEPRRASQPAAPVGAGSRYRVQEGDTLSTIAARVPDRGTTGIWQLADLIFAANPAAFIGANPDLIKLGAEIEIPAPRHVAAAVTAPASAAVPTVEPAPPPEQSLPDAIATSERAAETLPDANQPATVSEPATPASAPIGVSEPPVAVFQDEQPSAAEADAVPPAVERSEPRDEENGAQPWLAALIGILIGIVASFALLRERLLESLRSLARPGARTAQSRSAAATGSPTSAVTPQLAKPFAPRESSMVVVEERREDANDAGPASFQPTDRNTAIGETQSQPVVDTELDSELAGLFGAEPDVPLFETEAPGQRATAAELDLDLSEGSTQVAIPEDIGWIGDESALVTTKNERALTAPPGDTVEQMDLQSLARKADEDEELSQTLKEALNLLEHDYEDELTASQVIDRSRFKELRDGSDDDDTLVKTGTDRHRRR